MALTCPSCQVPFRPQDLDLERSVARCAQCSSAMDLAWQDDGPTRLAHPLRPRVPIPERFVDREEAGRYVISWPWFKPQLLLQLLFVIAWNSFLYVWYRGALDNEKTNWGQILFPIAHVAVGVTLTYSTLAGFLNRTTIETTRGRLKISHGPVPWLGRELPVSSIQQIFCEARVVNGENNSTTYYDVSALLKDGKKRKLITNLTDLDQALFVEQRLEKAMKIADARVPGEIQSTR